MLRSPYRWVFIVVTLVFLATGALTYWRWSFNPPNIILILHEMNDELDAIDDPTARTTKELEWIETLTEIYANWMFYSYRDGRYLHKELVGLHIATQQYHQALTYISLFDVNTNPDLYIELMIDLTNKLKEDTFSNSSIPNEQHLAFVTESIETYIEWCVNTYKLHSPDNIRTKGTLVRSELMEHARQSAIAAELFETLKQTETAASLHEQSVWLANRVIAENTGAITQNAATLLLQQKYYLVDSLDEYVSYVEELVQRICPEQEILIFLDYEAITLSKIESPLNPNTLIAANRLFDIVLGLDYRWFNKEYKNNSFCQDALIIGADNAMKLNDREGATWRIAELENLTITNSYRKKQFASTKEQYAAFLASYENSSLEDSELLHTKQNETGLQNSSVHVSQQGDRSSMPSSLSSLQITSIRTQLPKPVIKPPRKILGMTFIPFLSVEFVLVVICSFLTRAFAQTEIGVQLVHRLRSPVVIVCLVLFLIGLVIVVSSIDRQQRTYSFTGVSAFSLVGWDTIWIPMLLTTTICVAGIKWLSHGTLHLVKSVCSTCKYDLRGMTVESCVCPECGNHVTLGTPTPPYKVIHVLSTVPGWCMLAVACFGVLYLTGVLL